jgi:hypothetical protein
LAIVTGGCVENIGKIVHVDRALSYGAEMDNGILCGIEGLSWQVSGQLWVRVWPDMRLTSFRLTCYGDAHLRPISGVPIDEETRDEVPA